MDVIYLMLIGMMASSYPEFYHKNGNFIVKEFERRLDKPYLKDYSPLLGEIGFEINKQGLCLFPAYMLRQRPAFEEFFLENGINDETQ